MKTIAHISDLHFGAEDPHVAQGLLSDLAEVSPQLVVVSGDLTQRAKVQEFIAARDWLARIRFPKIIVPGNHDVPLYDVVRRFITPLRRYRAYICNDLLPFMQDEHLAVLGVSTARSWTWKRGRINAQQIAAIRSRMLSVPPSTFKIVVTHHQFIPPVIGKLEGMVGRANQALAQLEHCGVDLLLAGHLHLAFTGDAKAHYADMKRSILVAQAGTSISHRRRGEPNAYNFITVNGDALTITARTWNGARFAAADSTSFRKHAGEWQRLS